MARVSISEAAKLAGISRNSLYKTYISKGRITVSSDKSSKKYIETSELLRVFHELQDDSQGDKGGIQQDDNVLHPDTALLIENKLLAQQLEEAKVREQKQEQQFAEREQFYQEQIKELTSTVKLLDAPKYPRLWWQFWK